MVTRPENRQCPIVVTYSKDSNAPGERVEEQSSQRSTEAGNGLLQQKSGGQKGQEMKDAWVWEKKISSKQI